MSFVSEVGPIYRIAPDLSWRSARRQTGFTLEQVLGGLLLFHSSLRHLAEDPVEKTTAAHHPPGSKPHVPVQDTGQECILFRQRNVSCCSVTWFRGSWSYLGLFFGGERSSNWAETGSFGAFLIQNALAPTPHFWLWWLKARVGVNVPAKRQSWMAGVPVTSRISVADTQWAPTSWLPVDGHVYFDLHIARGFSSSSVHWGSRLRGVWKHAQHHRAG